MKAYIATTGILFVALAVAHGLRILAEPRYARDPWFLVTTLIALGLAVWAVRLFRTFRGSRFSPSNERL